VRACDGGAGAGCSDGCGGVQNRAMSESLLTDGKMLTRIIDAHKDNDEAVKQPKSCRKGYMGQLRQISNLIQDRAKEEAWMRTYTQGPEWVNFCDTYLAQLNDVNDGRQLGRAHANGLAPQSDGEEEEEDDTPIPLDTNFDSQFEFRSPDQPDELFDNDAGALFEKCPRRHAVPALPSVLPVLHAGHLYFFFTTAQQRACMRQGASPSDVCVRRLRFGAGSVGGRW